MMNTPRPVPTIADDSNFSRKKKSLLNDSLYAPRSPVKSAPPISRIFRHRRGSTPGAHSVSFRKSEVQGDVSMTSPLYKTYDQLYFDQCFTKLSKVGVGSFGEVWKVQSKEDGKLYAIKKSRDRFRGDFDRKQRLEEVNKSERIQGHCNCVYFHKAWEELDYLYIQYELCEMSLKDYAEKVQSVEEKEIWKMIIDFCYGLKHLHDANLAHMDIKPANLFLGRDGNYKIGDFGLVVELTRDVDAMDGDSKYIAPELLEGTFSKAADIFSLGITVLELACSLELPNGGPLWQRLRQKQLPNKFTTGLSDDLILLISSMMDPNPSNRPTVDQILRMPCVRQVNTRRPPISTYVSTITQPFFSLWFYFMWMLTSITSFFKRDYRTQSSLHHMREIKRPRTPSPRTSVFGEEGCTPLNTHSKAQESLSSQIETTVFSSPAKRSQQKLRANMVSPLFNKNSPLFRPMFNQSKSQESSPSGLFGESPITRDSSKSSSRNTSMDSPDLTDCSPQTGTVSERIVRSRLFTCSSDEDEDFDLQRVPKNLMSSFKEDSE
ncbi:membrane-associated tyrosine- and threonine-specific cdc2-inhibitory kinase-like isoform X2 [Clytia hemisphaerica]